MAFSTKNLVYSEGDDLGGIEATTLRAMRSASAAVSPGSGWGISAIAARMASSKSAEVSPGCDVGIEARADSTIRSTSSSVV